MEAEHKTPLVNAEPEAKQPIAPPRSLGSHQGQAKSYFAPKKREQKKRVVAKPPRALLASGPPREETGSGVAMTDTKNPADPVSANGTVDVAPAVDAKQAAPAAFLPAPEPVPGRRVELSFGLKEEEAQYWAAAWPQYQLITPQDALPNTHQALACPRAMGCATLCDRIPPQFTIVDVGSVPRRIPPEHRARTWHLMPRVLAQDTLRLPPENGCQCLLQDCFHKLGEACTLLFNHSLYYFADPSEVVAAMVRFAIPQQSLVAYASLHLFRGVAGTLGEGSARWYRVGDRVVMDVAGGCRYEHTALDWFDVAGMQINVMVNGQPYGLAWDEVGRINDTHLFRLTAFPGHVPTAASSSWFTPSVAWKAYDGSTIVGLTVNGVTRVRTTESALTTWSKRFNLETFCRALASGVHYCGGPNYWREACEVPLPAKLVSKLTIIALQAARNPSTLGSLYRTATRWVAENPKEWHINAERTPTAISLASAYALTAGASAAAMALDHLEANAETLVAVNNRAATWTSKKPERVWAWRLAGAVACAATFGLSLFFRRKQGHGARVAAASLVGPDPLVTAIVSPVVEEVLKTLAARLFRVPRWVASLTFGLLEFSMRPESVVATFPALAMHSLVGFQDTLPAIGYHAAFNLWTLGTWPEAAANLDDRWKRHITTPLAKRGIRGGWAPGSLLGVMSDLDLSDSDSVPSLRLEPDTFAPLMAAAYFGITHLGTKLLRDASGMLDTADSEANLVDPWIVGAEGDIHHPMVYTSDSTVELMPSDVKLDELHVEPARPRKPFAVADAPIVTYEELSVNGDSPNNERLALCNRAFIRCPPLDNEAAVEFIAYCVHGPMDSNFGPNGSGKFDYSNFFQPLSQEAYYERYPVASRARMASEYTEFKRTSDMRLLTRTSVFIKKELSLGKGRFDEQISTPRPISSPPAAMKCLTGPFVVPAQRAFELHHRPDDGLVPSQPELAAGVFHGDDMLGAVALELAEELEASIETNSRRLGKTVELSIHGANAERNYTTRPDYCQLFPYHTSRGIRFGPDPVRVLSKLPWNTTLEGPQRAANFSSKLQGLWAQYHWVPLVNDYIVHVWHTYVSEKKARADHDPYGLRSCNDVPEIDWQVVDPVLADDLVDAWGLDQNMHTDFRNSLERCDYDWCASILSQLHKPAGTEIRILAEDAVTRGPYKVPFLMGTTLDQLSLGAWYKHHYGWAAIMCIDYSRYDGSQNEADLRLKTAFFEKIGFPDWLVSIMHVAGTERAGFTTCGIRFRGKWTMTTGETTTYFWNTVLNMCYFAYYVHKMDVGIADQTDSSNSESALWYEQPEFDVHMAL